LFWNIAFQVHLSGASHSSFLFVWIDTHALPNAAFNIRPFIAGAFHAPPNAHDAFFFSFTEIVYQTHLDLLFGPGAFWTHLLQ
jgi:hypothetical protein